MDPSRVAAVFERTRSMIRILKNDKLRMRMKKKFTKKKFEHSTNG
jgi:hypothetical protein